MAISNINVGTIPNDGLGDFLRTAFIKVNDNFTYVDSVKVDKITGWGLSQNNFSPTYKSQLDNLQANLNLKANIASPMFSWFVGIDTILLSPTTAFKITLDGTESMRITKSGQIKASRFELYGGLGSQFLMADGSSNSASYVIQTGAIAQRVPLFGTDTNTLGNSALYTTGGLWVLGSGAPSMTSFFEVMGSIKGTSFVKTGGTSAQFLKADGSVDSNTYALAGSIHNAVTIGTGNGLSLSTQVLSLGLASSGANGALSSTDWNTFNGKQSALVSGTSIKTIEGVSLLGSGNLDITATSVGLGNVDNTSDINKPISTNTQAALNLKANIASPIFSWFAGIDCTILSPTNAFTITLDGTPSMNITKAGAIKASRFEIYGGSGNSFLMADGSTNSANYILANNHVAGALVRFGSTTGRIEQSMVYETGGNLVVGGGSPTYDAKLEVPAGAVKATGFKIYGGNSTQYLMADGSVSTGGGGGVSLPYKEARFVCTLSTTPGNQSMSTVYENSIGGTFTVSRTSTGTFDVTNSGRLITSKTTLTVQHGQYTGGTRVLYFCSQSSADGNKITFLAGDSSTGSPIDSGTNILITVRVYN
jgi:hypothetical protein